MARFSIYSADGKTVRYSGMPKYNGTYMKVPYIEFSEIASPVPIEWEVGDYLDYPRTGLRYRLYSIPQPKKQARRGEYGAAFVYSNVQLHDATRQLETALFNDLVLDAEKNVHFSTRENVSTYEDVYGIARRIQANMDEFYPGKWLIRVMDLDGDDDAELLATLKEAKEFSLSSGSCLGALNQIYNTWEGIGWVHTYDSSLGKDVITIGRPNKRDSSNTTSAFLYGLGKGLTAIKKSYTNTDEFATRLYVYGSGRNLPNRYYNGLSICNAASVDIANLMIPLDSWGKATDPVTGETRPDASLAYVENASAVAKYGVVPKKVYFDGSQNEEIYPTIKNMTVGKLRAAKSESGDTAYVPSSTVYTDDDERLDVVKGADNPSDNGYDSGDDEIVAEDTVDCYLPAFEDTMANTTSSQVLSIARTVLTYTPASSGTRVSIQPSYRFYVTVSPEVDSWTVRQVVTVTVRDTDGTTYTMDTDDTSTVLSPAKLDSQGRYRVALADKYIIAAGTIASIRIDLVFERESTAATDMTVTMWNMNNADRSCHFGFMEDITDTFKLYIKQIGFNIKDCTALASGGIATISMKDGMCGGRDFTVKRCTYRKETDDWELNVKRTSDSSVNMLYPNASFPISTGDTFVLLDIEMPALYILMAQETLLEVAKDMLAQVSAGRSYYEPEIDAKAVYTSGAVLKEGMYMQIEDPDIIEGQTDYVLIDTITISEDESNIPIYKVTLSEKKRSSYAEVTAAVLQNLSTQIKANGQAHGRIGLIRSGDTAAASDDLAYSSLRSRMEFLSRLNEDTAAEKIKFMKGADFGEAFASGLTGFGGRIDKSGNGELDTLTLRRWLEVPELRYNRIVIQVGNSWRAPGGGIIQRVEQDYDSDGNALGTGTVWLHLEEGEIGTVAVDDICQGIWHDGITVSENATADLDDGIGNFKFAGFFTAYFRVTEILASDNSSFRYSIRPVSDSWTGTKHPCAGMHFVAYGNFSDTTRQTSRYSTRTYERYLKDVTTWEFTQANIAAQFGDLSNLSVFGLDMTGYSGYVENLYFTGHIEEVTNYPLRLVIDTGGVTELAYGESLTVTCALYKGWNDWTDRVTSWKIERDTGDATSDAAWALLDKAKDFKGTITIEHSQAYSDLGADVLSTLFTVTAEIDDENTATYTLEL